jgi:hypothetical protein
MAEQDHAGRPASAAALVLLPEAMAAAGTDWSSHLAPLGVPTAFIADDPILLAAAGAAYADWKMETPARPVLELSLTLAGASVTDVSLGIRVEGSRLTLAGEGFSGWADAVTGRAACTVAERLVGERTALAFATDTLLLFLLARSGRTPVHAAGVVLDGLALALAGPSGSGKSTLALAAMKRGLDVLSDDTIYVQHAPHLRVWGFPRPIHVFREDAPAGTHPMRDQGGKRKAAIPLAARALFADRAALVLLERGERAALTPIDGDTAIAGLGRLEPGFDLLADQSAAAMRLLAEGGAWRLTLERDPHAAIDLLCREFGTE